MASIDAITPIQQHPTRSSDIWQHPPSMQLQPLNRYRVAEELIPIYSELKAERQQIFTQETRNRQELVVTKFKPDK